MQSVEGVITLVQEERWIWPRWSAAWSCCALNRPRHGEKGAPGGSLERYNAVLSMIIGGEYPLAGLRRGRFHKARDQLASRLVAP